MLQIVHDHVMVAICCQPAACQMDIASVGVRMNTGEGAVTSLVTVQMMPPAGTGMGSASPDV